MYHKIVIVLYLILLNIIVVSNAHSAAQCSGMVFADNIADGADIDPATLAQLLGRAPKPYVPFTTQEVNEWIGYFQTSANPVAPVEGDRLVTVDTTNTIIYQEYIRNEQGVLEWVSVPAGTINTLLAELNDFEQEMTAIGFSLRDSETDTQFDNVHMLYTDPVKFREQMLHDLKLKAATALVQCLDSIPSNSCPQFDLDYVLNNLGAAVERIETLPDGSKQKVVDQLNTLNADQEVTINGNKVTIQSVISAANVSAKIACAIGVHLYDAIPVFSTSNLPGVNFPVITWNLPDIDIDGFGSLLIGGIDKKLTDLACPDFLCNALAGISFPGLSGGGGESGQWWKGYLDFSLADLSSPEALKLKAIGNLLNGVSNALDIPDLSNMPVLDPPVYKNLELKKRKDWPGINRGDKGRVGFESLAYYQIYGSELAQAATAYAKFSAWLLNREVNIVSASGDFFVGVSTQSNILGSTIPNDMQDQLLAYANLKLRYFGNTWESPNNTGVDLSITIGPDEPLKLFRFQKAYNQQFAIGPIPVVLTIGGYFDSGIDWGAGVAPMKIFAQVEPYALGSGYVQAGVGVSGFSIGAGGEIHIVKVGVPLEGAVKLGFSEVGEAYLDLNISAILEATVLSGRLYGYVEYKWPKFSWKPGFKTVRKTKTIVNFRGDRYEKPIFDWGMELGYRGLKMRGELLDQQDLAMAEQLQNTIDIYSRAEVMSQYVTRTNTRLVNFYTKLGEDLVAETIDIPTSAQTVVTASTSFEQNLNDYKCKMSVILGTPCI